MIFNYKKFQILLHADSKKTQGLQTGDIVRRQYFDGKNVIYSLMAVLSYGVETVQDEKTREYKERAYFIGALLEGDEPKNDEILDFARITNLFNGDRSGALYLTASDSDAPFMDVIDNIGRLKSLSWPENVSLNDYEDSVSQYVVAGKGNFQLDYTPYYLGNSRIVSITRMSAKTDDFEGLHQDFYQFVENPNCVLISYKIKASKSMSLNAKLGYIDDLKNDGEWTEQVTTDWQYKFRAVVVDYSGRHLRSFKMDLGNLAVGDKVEIADFNIILLSSVANFADGGTSRVGKLDGVVDPVFGRIDGYGAYLQKLYASRAAHISGTLTAGDENGFGATFYAGKIHRNSFINSVEVEFVSEVVMDNITVVNPTGVGNIYRSDTVMKMKAQSREWLDERIEKRYCFSFWVYAKQPCQIGVMQNDVVVDTIQIMAHQTHEWRRVSATFKLISPEISADPMIMGLVPTFSQPVFDDAGTAEISVDEAVYYFTAPQLETGDTVTQYQPTDEHLNYTEDYGAWFSKGGIGGTIQNPVLRLNDEGIFSRNDSFKIFADGSGQFANGRFKWNREEITLQGITIRWEDLDESAQNELKPKSVNIIGENVFVIDRNSCSPSSVTIRLVETNFEATPQNCEWYYLNLNDEYVRFEDALQKYLEIFPDGAYWNNKSTLTVKCVVKNNQDSYVDTITIHKSRNGEDAYSVKIMASNGNTFKNGVGTTTLTAHVFRGGNEITSTLFKNNFDWIKTSKNKDTDRIFNNAHLGYGNSLEITSDDVFGTAQFDCKVRIN